MLIEIGCSRIEQEQPTLKLYMKLLYILSSKFLYSCQLLQFSRPPHAYKHITTMCNAESAPAIIVHEYQYSEILFFSLLYCREMCNVVNSHFSHFDGNNDFKSTKALKRVLTPHLVLIYSKVLSFPNEKFLLP